LVLVGARKKRQQRATFLRVIEKGWNNSRLLVGTEGEKIKKTFGTRVTRKKKKKRESEN